MSFLKRLFILGGYHGNKLRKALGTCPTEQDEKKRPCQSCRHQRLHNAKAEQKPTGTDGSDGKAM